MEHCETQEGCSKSIAHALANSKCSCLTVLTPRAPSRDAVFITLIIKAPVIQLLSIVLAGFIIALEFPVPYLKGTKLHRAIALRIPLLLVQAFVTVLFYQVNFLLLRAYVSISNATSPL